MSTSVLPTLPGLEYPVTRTSVWKTRTQQNLSGKEIRIADWSSPRYRWEITFSGLRETAALSLEFSQLMGFFDTLQGGWDSFLYTDPNDNNVTTQAVGTGDGTTTVFALVRTLGGAVVPILAPNLGVAPVVKVSGVTKATPADYTIFGWGTGNVNGPGSLVFTAAPAAAAPITVTYTYYWPCRFDQDEMSFGLFMKNLYEAKKIAFMSIK